MQNKPNKQDFKNVKFDDRKDLIVSMIATSDLKRILNNFKNSELIIQDKTLRRFSTTLVSDNKKQELWMRPFGFVFNTDALDVKFGTSYQDPTLKDNRKISLKKDIKKQTKHPEKPVTKGSLNSRGLTTSYDTDYTRYDITTDTLYLNRTNKEAIDNYTKAFAYKYEKNFVMSKNDKYLSNNFNDSDTFNTDLFRLNELLVDVNLEKSPFKGLIFDMQSHHFDNSNSLPYKYFTDIEKICLENPNFDFYIRGKDFKITVIDKNKVKDFFEELKTTFQDENIDVNDEKFNSIISKHTVLLAEHEGKKNIIVETDKSPPKQQNPILNIIPSNIAKKTLDTEYDDDLDVITSNTKNDKNTNNNPNISIQNIIPNTVMSSLSQSKEPGENQSKEPDTKKSFASKVKEALTSCFPHFTR